MIPLMGTDARLVAKKTTPPLLLALSLALVAPAPPAGADQSINAQLRSAVGGAASQLGITDPTQRRIFEEEVLPNPQRFIRDYRASDKGVSVEADLDSIRNYLYFSAAKSLQGQDTRGLAFVWAEPECAKCVASANDIRSLVKARIERRGLRPVWLSVQDTGDPRQWAKPMGDRLAEIAKSRGVGAAVGILLKNIPTEELDAAHADEAHYRVQSWFQVGSRSRHEGSLEVGPNEEFEPTALRLLTDALTEVGAKLALAEQFGSGARGEILVEVTGVQDYAQAQRVKARLQGALKDAQNVEERRISKGKVVYAVTTARTADEVRRAVASVAAWDAPPPSAPQEAGAQPPERSTASVAPPAAQDPLRVEVK